MATTLLNAWIYKTTDKIDPSGLGADYTIPKRYRDGFYVGKTTEGLLVVEDKDGEERSYEVGSYTTMHVKGCTKIKNTSTITSVYCLQMCD